MAIDDDAQAQAQAEDYHFFYNPFQKAINTDE